MRPQVTVRLNSFEEFQPPTNKPINELGAGNIERLTRRGHKR